MGTVSTVSPLEDSQNNGVLATVILTPTELLQGNAKIDFKIELDTDNTFNSSFDSVHFDIAYK